MQVITGLIGETTRKLPNIRRCFLPDKGKLLCDCDLSGADARIVAWEAKDEDLKAAFNKGLDVHDYNGRQMYGDSYDPKRPGKIKATARDELKSAVHGTNYGASPRTLAITFGWTIREAEQFQHRWFSKHPGIRDWHRRVERDLQTKRSVGNKFGNRIIYFDRPDNLLPKGLAWIPQSTVAGICARAAIKLSKELPWVEVLLQVHDSIIFQVSSSLATPERFSEIRRALEIPVPYEPDPCIIPWGLATSPRSWGEVKKVNWEAVT